MYILREGARSGARQTTDGKTVFRSQAAVLMLLLSRKARGTDLEGKSSSPAPPPASSANHLLSCLFNQKTVSTPLQCNRMKGTYTAHNPPPPAVLSPNLTTSPGLPNAVELQCDLKSRALPPENLETEQQPNLGEEMRLVKKSWAATM